MEKIELWRMDVAAEIVMCVVLALMLVTCFTQKKSLSTTKPLTILVFVDLLLMLCQLAGWGMTIVGYDRPDVAQGLYPWKKLVYTADYSLYYFLSVAYYNYVTAHIRDKYRQSGTTAAETKNWQIKCLILWGIIITGVFAVGINNSRLYSIDAAGNENYLLGVQAAADLLATVGIIFSMITLVRHRKILGNVSFALLMAYIITPGIFVLPDLVEGTCFNYLISAFFVLILYIHVDVREKELLEEKEAQLIRQEKELVERNTQIMLSQMQPHFLYNTLTTISSLCYIEGAAKAKQVVDRFSDYFRANLDSMGKDKYIHFEKELEHIKNYLWLESVRFEDSLHVVYDIQVSDFHLPSLSIQPLVENAVKHGIRKKKGGGTVTLRTRETETEYLVIVEDDGAGFEAGTISNDGRSHVGIENIKTRLDLLCGGECEIRSTIGEGTTATVHIPKEVKSCR